MPTTAPPVDNSRNGGGHFAAWAGMGRFTLIWSGQVVSLLGNSMLRFSFIIEMWARGERATAVVMLSVCALLPQVLLSPVAGAIVDRYRKRTALQVADAGGLIVVTGLSMAYLAGGGLDPWLVYPAVVLLGACAAFQFPAMASAVPLLVRRDQLQRANGLLASARSVAEVCGPALGGAALALAGLGSILGADLVSFAFALVTIRLVRLPDDVVAGAPRAGSWRGLAGDSLEGVRYLFAHASLRDLMLVFFSVNLVMVFGFAALQPMVLARTGNNIAVLASVNTAVGVGGVAGGLLLAAWGGPRNRVRGMLLGIIGMCLSAQIAMAVSRGVLAWCAAILIGAMLMPVVNAAVQSIVQTKIPREWQGRVFGAVLFGSQISAPLAMAVSGPLADQVFEPQRASGSGLAGLLAPVVGTGPGSGMAAMLLMAGVSGVVVALWGMARRTVRELDARIPDLPAARAPEDQRGQAPPGAGVDPAGRTDATAVDQAGGRDRAGEADRTG
jgi:MFS family permease